MEQLWNGKINPCRTCGENDPEMEDLLRLMTINKKKLEADISEKQRKALKNYLDCEEEYLYLACLLAFTDGFSLGMKLLGESVF